MDKSKNKFEQMAEAKKIADRKPDPNISGSFDCQTCGVTVYGAYFDGVSGMITWVCPESHNSFISDSGL